jgi:dTDP-4-amino-4,6-dideoxygalactose transaminase
MLSLFGSNVGDAELAAVRECMERQWLGIGAKCDEFERKIAQRVGAQDFVFLNSGSNALQMALKLMELPEGSEVVLPTFTWIACANAVQLNRLVPVFCDIDPATCNMLPEHVEAKITPRTSAIMVVHYGGKPVDMDGIQSFGLPVLEDAAHAIDSKYKGKSCGTIGDTGIFSFDAVKNLTTTEGGGVLAQDPERLVRARRLRYCGIAKSGFQSSATKARWWEVDITDSFPKMLPTDVNAAVGLVQLERLDDFQRCRRELWDRYQATLQNADWATSWLDTPEGPAPDERHSYFCYLIRLRAGSRDALAHFLYERGVYTSLRFHPLHLYPIYGRREQLPNAEHLSEWALNLPIHHRMTEADVDKVLGLLAEFRRTRV